MSIDCRSFARLSGHDDQAITMSWSFYINSARPRAYTLAVGDLGSLCL